MAWACGSQHPTSLMAFRKRCSRPFPSFSAHFTNRPTPTHTDPHRPHTDPLVSTISAVSHPFPHRKPLRSAEPVGLELSVAFAFWTHTLTEPRHFGQAAPEAEAQQKKLGVVVLYRYMNSVIVKLLDHHLSRRTICKFENGKRTSTFGRSENPCHTLGHTLFQETGW